MRPTIYIAGPMKGYPNFNREAFNKAASKLWDAGWQPINPVCIEQIYPCEENGKVCRIRLLELKDIERSFVAHADAIYLLDGWEASSGARTELNKFLSHGGFSVFLESNGTPNVRVEGSGTPDVREMSNGTPETPSMGGVQ